jgi:hypothetical protein
MKSIKVITLFLIFSVSSINAQKNELGLISIQELKETKHQLDSTASAVYKYKVGKTFYEYDRDGSWTITTDVYIRIKIYDKDGFKYADQKIPFYSNRNNEKIEIKYANTYNLEDGKIIKSKLNSESEFIEEINENWSVKKLAFPMVKEGSIIEYSYRLISSSVAGIDDWEFQKEIPVDFVKYEISIPAYYKYRTVITGYETIEVEEKEISHQAFPQTLYTYTGKNIPGIIEEKYVNNIKNYTSILKFELASIKYPNMLEKNLALNWEGVVQSIYEHEDFGDELKISSYYSEELNSLNIDNLTPLEKVKKIFLFVQNTITWNEKHGILCDLGVKKAFKEKTGNVADINLMLVSMLRKAGLDANPVLLSTRANGISIYPNRTAFNYVIASVFIDEKPVLLDASSKYSSLNVIPNKTLNWNGRLIRKEGTSVDIDLMNFPVSNEINSIMVTLNEDGFVEGKMRRQYLDFNAMNYREKYKGVKKEDYIGLLEENFEGIEINNLELTGIDENDLSITELIDFKHSKIGEKIGEKIYISPLLFFQLEENPFKIEDRKYPVNFNFPFKDVYKINIKIPDGYVVDYVPESTVIVMENKFVLFSFKIESIQDVVQVNSQLEVRYPLIPSNEYASLKSLFNEMIIKQSEKIVLKNKS